MKKIKIPRLKIVKMKETENEVSITVEISVIAYNKPPHDTILYESTNYKTLSSYKNFDDLLKEVHKNIKGDLKFLEGY